MAINDILREVEAGLIGQQRWLITLKQKRHDDSDLAEKLDPLIAKLEKFTGYLTELRDELRALTVTQRA